jgi:hypothetical protein
MIIGEFEEAHELGDGVSLIARLKDIWRELED